MAVFITAHLPWCLLVVTASSSPTTNVPFINEPAETLTQAQKLANASYVVREMEKSGLDAVVEMLTDLDRCHLPRAALSKFTPDAIPKIREAFAIPWGYRTDRCIAYETLLILSALGDTQAHLYARSAMRGIGPWSIGCEHDFQALYLRERLQGLNDHEKAEELTNMLYERNIARAARRFLPSLGNKAFSALSEIILNKGAPDHVRNDALFVLKDIATAEVIPTLQQVLRNPNNQEFSRRLAVKGLRSTGDPKVLPVLMSVLAELPPDPPGSPKFTLRTELASAIEELQRTRNKPTNIHNPIP